MSSEKKLTIRMAKVDPRVFRVLHQSSDLTLLVLRGHLLVEERLRSFLAGRVLKPRLLDRVRLTASQSIRLAHCYLGMSEDALPWSFILRLNSLRNELVHLSEAPDLEARVIKLVKLLPSQTHPPSDRDNTALRFIHAMAFALGYLEALVRIREQGITRETPT